MKDFLRKLAFYIVSLLCMAGVLAAVLLFGVAPQYSQGYNASVMDKMTRLRSISEPKIILVGDSNLAYGMDSAVLEETFLMPVVNLGLHGGLGNIFHERMLRGQIRAGDIVIVSHTGYGDTEKIIDPELAWITIENHFDLWPIIPPASYPDMLKAFPKYAEKALRLSVSGTGNQASGNSYQRSAFNLYGDVSYDRPDGIYEKTGAQHTGLPEVTDAGASRLNAIDDICRSVGARLFVAAYPVMDDGFAPTPDQFADCMQALSEKLTCPVISDFADYYYPPELFYNTAYHMTSHGAHLRAEQLSADLAAALEE